MHAHFYGLTTQCSGNRTASDKFISGLKFQGEFQKWVMVIQSSGSVFEVVVSFQWLLVAFDV